MVRFRPGFSAVWADIRPKLWSGLWHPFCSLCVSQRTPRSFSQLQIPPQTPSYFAFNSRPVNMPVVFPASLLCSWQSQLQIREEEHVGKRKKQLPWGLKAFGLGVPVPRLTASDYGTYLSRENSSNRSHGILFPYGLPVPPKKGPNADLSYSNRCTTQRSRPWKHRPVWSLRLRRSKGAV